MSNRYVCNGIMKMRSLKHIMMGFIVSFLLLSPSPISSSFPRQIASPNSQDYERIKILDIDVFFVGYDPAHLDLGALQNELDWYFASKPLNMYYSSGAKYLNITYAVHFNFTFANKTYYRNLRSFLLENSKNGTNIGNTVNETAISFQLRDGIERDIFVPQSGRSFDAHAIETWLVEHPLVKHTVPRHTFYVFNFSEFDSSDHSLEHWYSNPNFDPDSGHLEDYWRLPWDNPLNTPMIHTFPGFQSNSRIYFLDPTASQWYLKWAYTWWERSVDEEHTYVINDLDDLQRTFDLSLYPGQLVLADYLVEWLRDLVKNLIFPNLLESELVFLPPKNRTVSVQILTFVEPTPLEDFKWLVHEEVIQETFEDLLPFFNWIVDVRFEKLADYSDLVSEIQSHTLFVDDNGRHIDGTYFLNYFYGRRPDFFDVETHPFTVTCFNLALDNASLYFQERDYSGLAVQGMSVILMDQERFYRPDGTKKRGLTSILTHEIGHAIGLEHTFDHNTGDYAGDFSVDTMGYFVNTPYFCGFRKDFLRRVIVDIELRNLLVSFNEIKTAYSLIEPPTKLIQQFEAINSSLARSEALYNQLDYVGALHEADLALRLTEELSKQSRDAVRVNEFIQFVLPVGVLSILALVVIFFIKRIAKR